MSGPASAGPAICSNQRSLPMKVSVMGMLRIAALASVALSIGAASAQYSTPDTGKGTGDGRSVADRFAAIDADGDGRISEAEARAALQRLFDRIDADQSGAVDVPEGFATIANFKDVPRGRRLLLGASFSMPVLLAATLAHVLLRGQGEALKMAALVFTAGLLTVAAVEDMIVEAHEVAEIRVGRLAFVGGFVLFTLVSAGLGGQTS